MLFEPRVAKLIPRTRSLRSLRPIAAVALCNPRVPAPLHVIGRGKGDQALLVGDVDLSGSVLLHHCDS